MNTSELRGLADELELEASHTKDAEYLRKVADEIDRLTTLLTEYRNENVCHCSQHDLEAGK